MIAIFLSSIDKDKSREGFSPFTMAFWSSEEDVKNNPLIAVICNNFKLVTDIHQADAVVLPRLWNFYVNQKQRGVTDQIYQESAELNKPFVIFSAGDFTANIPYPNVTIFQSSAYRSRNGQFGQRLFVTPSFISDYLNLYCDGTLQLRDWNSKPTIGFCGQAYGTIVDYMRRKARIIISQIAYKTGLLQWEPPPIEPSFYRNKILKQIQRSPFLKTEFIMRQKYRAGYTLNRKKDPFHPTRIEFIKNILNSDYTVCMRGVGNFSVRLYETLSLGRIPVFVDSDSPLPYEEWIDYRDYFVYVKETEVPYIAEKILEFHNNLTPQKFKDLQGACRDLWAKYFTIQGYYSYLPKLIL